MVKLIACAAVLLLATGVGVDAAEITVLSANGAKLILEALTPQFERATGNRLAISYGEAGILRKRILDGEAFDVAFLPAGWDEVRAKLTGEPVAIAHTDFGMAVLANAPKPDTSSNDAVKRVLLAASTIVYTDPKTGGISGVLFARMIERLGIADEVNKKSKLVAGVLNASLVVKGRGRSGRPIGQRNSCRAGRAIRTGAARVPCERYVLRSNRGRSHGPCAGEGAAAVSHRTRCCPGDQIQGVRAGLTREPGGPGTEMEGTRCRMT